MCKIPKKAVDHAEQERRAREWADRAAEEDEAPAYEPTYRDGSLKTECWNQEDL